MLTEEPFGAQVRYYREVLGMSQRALAKRIGLTASHLNRIEHGSRRSPSVEKLLAIVAELRLTEAQAEQLVSVAGYSSAILRAGVGPLSYPSPSLQVQSRDDALKRLEMLLDRLPPAQKARCLEAITTLIESLIASAKDSDPL